MSNSLHKQIGDTGMLKKTGAVINLVVTDEYAKSKMIPFLTNKGLNEYINIAKERVKELNCHSKKVSLFIVNN